MAASKTLVLITGGNSGVGYSLAGLLLADASKHILLGCRSIEKGTAATKELTSLKLPGTVELLQIDVADETSITNAAQQVSQKYGRLDALVNNAAIGGISRDLETASLTTMMLSAYQTNVIGPLLTVEAFIPLLRKSTTTPRIINVSSGAGLVAHHIDPKMPSFGIRGVPYSASKAALNLVTGHQIREYGPEGVKLFGYTPGFVVSCLGPYNNAESGADPTEKGARPIVGIVNGERDAEHGMFLRREGTTSW